MAKKTPEELFSEINELNHEELEILAAALRKSLDVSVRNRGRDEPYGEIPSPGFEIYLIECDTHNVQAIKLIHGFTCCSLTEAKECLNHLPIKIENKLVSVETHENGSSGFRSWNICCSQLLQPHSGCPR